VIRHSVKFCFHYFSARFTRDKNLRAKFDERCFIWRDKKAEHPKIGERFINRHFLGGTNNDRMIAMMGS
jgi:hypothetical protein